MQGGQSDVMLRSDILRYQWNLFCELIRVGGDSFYCISVGYVLAERLLP